MSDASVLQIVILNDGTLVGTEVVLPGTYAIGSDAASDLVLEDATVSSSHATLTYRDGRVFLEDAGSIGGLLVNGERTVSSEIKPKDDVTIGPFTLKIRVVAKKPPTKIASGHSLATTQPFASNKSVTGAAPAPLRPPLAQPLVKTPAPLQPAAPLQPIARPAPLQQKPAMPAAKAPVAAKPAPRPFAPARPTDPEMTPPASPNLLLPRPPPAAPLSTMEEVPIPISPGDLEQLKEVSADDWPSLVAPQPVKPSPAKPAPVAAKPAPAPEAHQPAPVERTDPGNTQELPLSREAPPPELDPTSSTASPELRVRVFWGRATVSVRSFRAGEKVLAGPSDDAPVPLYSFPLPGDRYEIAQFGKGG